MGLRWMLVMSSRYSASENTYEALTDRNESFEKGAATNCDVDSYIQASFAQPVLVRSVTVAAPHMAGGWNESNLNGVWLQCSDDGKQWTNLTQINNVQAREIRTIPIVRVSQHWRLYRNELKYVATGLFIFQ
eukprot:TRINITY_DN6294_c0_g1_i2.p1 TRINITY_DN6294_c0_g1~~TRINITY_DN6294_c0_g1_i2.p1  ORF type:complete len:132 (-),score=3.51 TRINITY_DN6294_c0_g1_i2:25-420(-)